MESSSKFWETESPTFPAPATRVRLSRCSKPTRIHAKAETPSTAAASNMQSLVACSVRLTSTGRSGARTVPTKQLRREWLDRRGVLLVLPLLLSLVTITPLSLPPLPETLTRRRRRRQCGVWRWSGSGCVFRFENNRAQSRTRATVYILRRLYVSDSASTVGGFARDRATDGRRAFERQVTAAIQPVAMVSDAGFDDVFWITRCRRVFFVAYCSVTIPVQVEHAPVWG